MGFSPRTSDTRDIRYKSRHLLRGCAFKTEVKDTVISVGLVIFSVMWVSFSSISTLWRKAWKRATHIWFATCSRIDESVKQLCKWPCESHVDLSYKTHMTSTNIFIAEDISREEDNRGAGLTSNHLSKRNLLGVQRREAPHICVLEPPSISWSCLSLTVLLFPQCCHKRKKLGPREGGKWSKAGVAYRVWHV